MLRDWAGLRHCSQLSVSGLHLFLDPTTLLIECVYFCHLRPSEVALSPEVSRPTLAPLLVAGALCTTLCIPSRVAIARCCSCWSNGIGTNLTTVGRTLSNSGLSGVISMLPPNTRPPWRPSTSTSIIVPASTIDRQLSALA